MIHMFINKYAQIYQVNIYSRKHIYKLNIYWVKYSVRQTCMEFQMSPYEFSAVVKLHIETFETLKKHRLMSSTINININI